MAVQMTNTSKAMFLKGQIRISIVEGAKDDFRLILMKPGFVFDRTVHVDYTSVETNEVEAGQGGYTKTGKKIDLNRIDISGATNSATAVFDPVNWIVSGSTLVTSSVILYDDTTDTETGSDYTDAVILWSSTDGTLSVTPGGSIVIPTVNLPFGEPVSTT
jgi:hypothetical protein